MKYRSKVNNIILVTIAVASAVAFFGMLPGCSQTVPSEKEVGQIEEAAPAEATAVPAKARKLLVFTRHEAYEHSSIPYVTKALEIMGQKTGAYEVVVSEDMSSFTSENLTQFDAVLFNNTTHLKFEDPVLRQSLLDFVKGGKGVAGIHAATDNFYTWPEGAAMIGGQFDGHPWTDGGTWAVKIDDPDHPLTAVFQGEGFKINDEIYRIEAPYSRENVRVLLGLDMADTTNLNVKDIRPSDKDMAISWIRNYGQGRVFYSSLGHNHHLFWNPAVLRHYLDGIQFALGDLAADATPSLDIALARIASYEYGQSREPLTELGIVLQSAYDEPEALGRIQQRLLELLQSEATSAGKQFVCRQLSIFGTEKAIPVLAGMLADATTSDMARYALERIPGSTADGAFREALPKARGKVKVGLINSLGQRRDRQSVAALRRLIQDNNSAIAMAAVAALGRIADPQATEALAEARGKTTGKLRQLVQDSYLKCADQLVVQGEQERARTIYQQLYASSEPLPIRTAALRGLILADAGKAVEEIVNVLRDGDTAMEAVAIGLVWEIPKSQNITDLTGEFGNLSIAGQVQLLAALADRDDPACLDAALTATKSDNADVRIAAFKALAALGDDSTVSLLVQVAASGSDAERETARASLNRLRGPETNTAIVAGIPQADPKVKAELIRSAGERRISSAVGTLLETAKDPDPDVRVESIKALRFIAGPDELPALIDLLIQAPDDAERQEAEKTVVAVAHKIPRKDRQSRAVLTALRPVKDAVVRGSLLQTLGKIGDSKALPTLRKALKDSDAEIKLAAIRALSDWPTAEPLADLLTVVRTSDDEVHRVLALRGHIRLTGLESDRPADETLKLYQEAMELASATSEKKMVLSGLGNVGTVAALEVATGYLDDSELQQEAEMAVGRIALLTASDYPEETVEALEKVLQVTENDQLRGQIQQFIDQIK
ncbi:MAG: HEAT repeat domain-containing protein [Fidelibacterota bacterium]|nr:MAG: HEAT repeat domain-containing protein [Candidatus Neomarinimicrobiota bacterium]